MVVFLHHFGCVAQLVEQRSPKSLVGGSSPSALVIAAEVLIMVLWNTGAIERKSGKGRSKVLSHLNEFFCNLKMEMIKVEWTGYEKLVSSTKLVLLFIFVSGMGIYFVDLCIKGSLDVVKVLLRRVFG